MRIRRMQAEQVCDKPVYLLLYQALVMPNIYNILLSLHLRILIHYCFLYNYILIGKMKDFKIGLKHVETNRIHQG